MSILKKIIVFILEIEARIILKKWKPQIVVVSGSVGKTSTKDAIFHALSLLGNVRGNQKSYNSEVGVPLTILGLESAWRSPLGWVVNMWKGFRLILKGKSYPSTLVLEVGSDKPGDITNLMKWLTPDIAVLTSLPEVPVHVENFSSPEELRNEDSVVFHSIKPGGVLVGNIDDPRILKFLNEKSEEGVRTISYGFHLDSDVRGFDSLPRYAQNEGVNAPVGMQFTVENKNVTHTLSLSGVLGKPACSAALAAIAVGLSRDLKFTALVEEMLTHKSPPGRMRLIAGKGGCTLIDDSYNSSPIALESALNELRGIQCGRKIAVLGDMLELGNFSSDEHWKAGRQAGGFLDMLVTVGSRARLMAEGAKSAGLPEGKIHMFNSAEEAGKFLLSEILRGDVILLKGSQGSGENKIRLEGAVKVLMSHVGDAETQLVRQGEEWSRQ